MGHSLARFSTGMTWQLTFTPDIAKNSSSDPTNELQTTEQELQNSFGFSDFRIATAFRNYFTKVKIISIIICNCFCTKRRKKKGENYI
jgi:hypothetical protein